MNEQYFSELNGYLVKDSRAVHTYDNVSSMKSDTNLRAGTHVRTKGYYNINDGGSAEYYVRNKTIDDVENNGTTHFVGDTLVAELITNGILNVVGNLKNTQNIFAYLMCIESRYQYYKEPEMVDYADKIEDMVDFDKAEVINSINSNIEFI